MASAKKLILRCTGISLLPDGRQQVVMQKAASAETGKTAAGATIVNQPDAELRLAVDAAESPTYAVGKDYTVAITG